jgi:hypothetical protein
MLVNKSNPSAALQLKEAADAARMPGRHLDVGDFFRALPGLM